MTWVFYGHYKNQFVAAKNELARIRESSFYITRGGG